MTVNDLMLLGAQSAVVLMVAAMFLWRYHVRAGRPAQRREFQYRVFALRDKAIALVAEGIESEDNADWREMYLCLNQSAKAVHVDFLKKNGLAYVLGLLAATPTPEDTERFRSLPPHLKGLWAEYAETVLGICWEGSKRLRVLVRVSKVLKRLGCWRQQSLRYLNLGARFASAVVGALVLVGCLNGNLLVITLALVVLVLPLLVLLFAELARPEVLTTVDRYETWHRFVAAR